MEVKTDMYSDGSLMDEVMQLMLQAETHSGGDPGVQVSICFQLRLTGIMLRFGGELFVQYFCGRYPFGTHANRQDQPNLAVSLVVAVSHLL